MKFIRRVAAEERGQSITCALLTVFILCTIVAMAAGYKQSVAGVAITVNSKLAAAVNSSK